MGYWQVSLLIFLAELTDTDEMYNDLINFNSKINELSKDYNHVRDVHYEDGQDMLDVIRNAPIYNNCL